jgi:hypothetical protein
MEITREQVLEIYDNHFYVDQKLQEWFPEAFKVGLEVGKVYKASGCIFYYQEANKSYGFSDGEWSKPSQWVVCEGIVKDPAWVISEATTEEWESTLIEEAKRRGYKNGNYECLAGVTEKVIDNYFFCNNMVLQGGREHTCHFNQVFKDGVWAEILKTFSKEEAEKLLGGKII